MKRRFELRSETIVPEAAAKTEIIRRSAQQQRSRAKVERILETTLILLGKNSAEKITTNSISKEARISVGTIYQYFSSKEEIFFELYQRWLNQTLEIMDRVDREFDSERGFAEYIDLLFYNLSCDDEINSPGHWQLRRAMASSKELSKLEVKHNEKVLVRILAFQERFGRQFDPHQAMALAHFQNQVSVACLSAAAIASNSQAGETAFQWCRKTLHFIFDVDKLM